MALKNFDEAILNLAWSLWTELGVNGVVQRNQETLILIEELILFTSALIELDPRLRDESLDWCSQFHHFISVSRLKFLMKDFESLILEPFSKYAATLNAIANTHWPVFVESVPIKVNLSRKSILRPHASPALLNIRARSIFGTGARADLLTFFLLHPNDHFSINEASQIGYTKRNLAEVMDDLHWGKLLSKFMQGNQQRFRLNQNKHLTSMLEPIPKLAPPWRDIFKILITLRHCLKRTANGSEITKAIEINDCLRGLEQSIQKTEMTPPTLQNDFGAYIGSTIEWAIRISKT